MQVLEGRLCIEVEGRERVLGPEDGEVRVESWANHRLYPPPTGTGGGGTTTRFLLSGGETEEVFRLDTVFFQNWYGYQDEVVLRGAKMDLVQVFSVSCITSIPLTADPRLLSLEAVGFPDRLRCGADVRCRWILPVGPVVGAFWPWFVEDSWNCRWEVVRGNARVSAVLQEMDHRLGVGVREDGDIAFPKEICGSCENGVNNPRLGNFKTYRGMYFI